jgi:hypothetical protein
MAVVYPGLADFRLEEETARFFDYEVTDIQEAIEVYKDAVGLGMDFRNALDMAYKDCAAIVNEVVHDDSPVARQIRQLFEPVKEAHDNAAELRDKQYSVIGMLFARIIDATETVDEKRELRDAMLGQLKGLVVVFDMCIRFLRGNYPEITDMRNHTVYST